MYWLFPTQKYQKENNILYEMKATNRDGADAETVVCALFHDVGEVLNHVNHGEIGKCTANDYDDDSQQTIQGCNLCFFL